MLKAEEEDPFEDHTYAAAQYQDRSERHQIVRKERSKRGESRNQEDRSKKCEGDYPASGRMDLFQRDPGRFAQMIQIKKNEKPLGAQESHGEETEKRIWG